jgi:outer membrane protein assembly factor BamB
MTVGVSADGGSTGSLGNPDGWWTKRGDAGRTGSVPSAELTDPRTIAWKYEEAGEFVVVDGTVYLQAGSGVHAIDAEDGKPEWEVDDLDASGSLSVIDDTVYVGGDAVTALDTETGETRWQRAFDDGVTVELAAFDAVYVAIDGDEPTLCALDANDGSIRWERETVTVDADDGTDGPQEYVVEPIATAVDDALYTVVEAPNDDEYALIALEPDSGETRWTAYHEDSGTWFAGLTVTENRAIVQYEFPREEPRVFVFDLGDRRFEGAISDRGYKGVATDGDYVALTSETRFSFHDVSTIADDHTESWSYGTATGFGDPVIAGDAIVTATNFGNRNDPDNDIVTAFDIADGSQLWRFTFDGVVWGEHPFDPVPAPVVDDGIIYIVREEELVALQASRDDDTDAEDDADDLESDEEDGVEPDEVNEPDTDEDDEDEGEDAETDDRDAETDDRDDEADDRDDEADDRDDEADENASTDDASDGDDTNGDGTETDDSVSGFTAGAGVAGGALTLEWLRRRATTDEPDEPPSNDRYL